MICHCIEEPSHHELMELLSSMSHQWSELGDCLELNYSDINSLRSSPIHSSSKEKLSEVLRKWKMQDTLPYTWLTIKDIVSGPVLCNRRVGSQIEKFLKKKKESKINFFYQCRCTIILMIILISESLVPPSSLSLPFSPPNKSMQLSPLKGVYTICTIMKTDVLFLYC